MANQTDRKGSFKFWVKGSTETFIPDSFVTKGGKIDNRNQITWNIILNKNSESLSNIHIVDTIQNNMKLDTNSIKIYSGKICNGQFYSTGFITPDKLNINGSTINIDFNQINSPIEIVYTVQKNPGTDFYNEVGVNVNGENYGAYAHVLTGGSGSGDGNTPVSSSIINSSSSNPTSSPIIKNNSNSKTSLSVVKSNSNTKPGSGSSINSSTVNQTHKQKLPQTGENINFILSALGIILLISIGSYIAYHHN